jgi:hypothetical protein
MSAEQIKALERRAFGDFNKGRAAYMAAMDDMFAADFVHHGGAGREIRGIKDYKQFINEMFIAFPDLHFTIDDMIAEGDKVVTRSKGARRALAPLAERYQLEDGLAGQGGGCSLVIGRADLHHIEADYAPGPY